ncbi:hypothetical protein PCH_Pc06g01060 [Penicillium rubens Wisconsin 54-1255]|uniref:Uncharacterized protein n=1 Tax=Penicillium rubens (strain ATCC 28089 / DSM 1075 / NRRL 1951 / Wisconsin 54-1255) TaxID=500485 RepID=B6GW45_PENRW|nr:hypothetical protein PCH_Pc06g01060 [Penicillium rubens Wisconsin 54-1255]
MKSPSEAGSNRRSPDDNSKLKVERVGTDIQGCARSALRVACWGNTIREQLLRRLRLSSERRCAADSNVRLQVLIIARSVDWYIGPDWLGDGPGTRSSSGVALQPINPANYIILTGIKNPIGSVVECARFENLEQGTLLGLSKQVV